MSRRRKLPSVAIVGRPNVGKSTLFNRLVGKRLAIVHDQPGVTRDFREARAKLDDLRFAVLDTAGLEDAEEGSLAARMTAMTERAIDAADVVIFMTDARAGLLPDDEHFAAQLRQRNKPTVLLVNKAEGAEGEAAAAEFWALGLSEPIPFSAAHGLGLDALHDALEEQFLLLKERRRAAEKRRARATDSASQEQGKDTESNNLHEESESLSTAPESVSEEPITHAPANDEPPARTDATEAQVSSGETERLPLKPLKLAIVGRPNAGKSTLINRLLGKERLLTGPEAGITRDAIAIDWTWHKRPIQLWDTAGMRKKAKVKQKLEQMSVGDGIRAAKFAEVAVVLLDATEPLKKQDLAIADLMAREGRAVVIAINKWDLVDREARARYRKELERAVDRLLPQIIGAPVVTLSALTGKGVDRLMPAVIGVHDNWNKRIPTARLNRWLEDAVRRHPPPAPGGRRIKLRYITQAATRPPTFVVFTQRADKVPEEYGRYLVKSLRDAFDLWGTPIRLKFREVENPYDDGSQRSNRGRHHRRR